MIMKIFSIRDAAVEGFLQPFFSPTSGAAIRSVTEAVNDPKHEFSKHAKDYSLWYLGDFNDSTGTIDPPESQLPQAVIACIDLLNKT